MLQICAEGQSSYPGGQVEVESLGTMTGPKRPARRALALTDLPKRCRLLRPAFDRGEALPVSDKDLFSRPAAFLFYRGEPLRLARLSSIAPARSPPRCLP